MTQIEKTKDLRKKLDDVLQEIKALDSSREVSIARTKVEEGIMWLGKNLGRLGQANPYPKSYDSSTGDVVEPTADGLKH